MERVMTYNIHGAVGTDGIYDPGRIVRVIREVNPSILGIQEVWHITGDHQGVLDALRERLPGYEILFLKTLSDERGSYGNALVTRHPVLDHVDLSLGSGGVERNGRRAEARRAIFARLDVEGTPIWVIVTHLAVEGWARSTQAEILLDAIDTYTGHGREPVIFMGDLNEWRLPNALLRKLDRTFSKHAMRRTFPARFPVIPLDRIWLSGQLTRNRVWTHRTHPSRRASDHVPLCLECQMARQ
ncbi:MAG TPA: endonuclease/exonuclease/phosphatase family protein [Alkalispirochaeta sp.]|nr:endonuclease/exonuclease/phosphatase family protein [Alkalispirochaeta sp.]